MRFEAYWPYTVGMSLPMMFEVKITATAEVRDAEGNLLSAEPVEMTQIMTEEEAAAFVGYTEPDEGDPK